MNINDGRGFQVGDGNTQNNNFQLLLPLVTRTIPGVILLAGGATLAFGSFLGWSSFIFRAMGARGAIDLPGPYLPSGIPLIACYFVGFAGGGLIAVVGGRMVRPINGRYQVALVRDAVVGALIVGVTAYCVHAAAGGVAYRDLLPHFNSCQWEIDAADDRGRWGPRPRLTMDEWTCKTAPE